MRKEPDIVKTLKEEESKGKLRGTLLKLVPSVKSSESVYDKDIDVIEDILDEHNGPDITPTISPGPSQQTLQTLMNLIVDPVVIVDKKGKFLEVSDRVEEMIGYKKEDLLGNNFMKTKFITAKSKATLIKGLAGRMLGKQIDTYEIEVVAKNGESILLEVKGMKVDYNGKPADLVVFHDVSKQRKAEDALREKEEQWVSLVYNVPDIILIAERDGTILSINHSVPGIDMEDVIGKTVYDYMEPEYHDTVKTSLERVFETGEPDSYQIMGVGPNQRQTWYETRIAPIMRNNEVIDVILISRDLIEQKKADEILRENEERYKSIVENSIDVIMLTQPDGIISYLSPSCKEVLEHDPLDLVGKKPWIIHPDDLEKVQEVFSQALNGKCGKNFEYRIQTEKGKTKWVSHTWSPILKDNTVQLIVSVVRDINEQKEAEEKLKEKLDELEKFQQVTVGRELQMMELKKEINALCNKYEEKERYIIDEIKEKKIKKNEK
jgi:PAS domain S-box-containing protein